MQSVGFLAICLSLRADEYAVIMGYGFSLPDNPADHFSIGFSPAISAYIGSVKARRSAIDSKFEHLGVNRDVRIKSEQLLDSVEVSEAEGPKEQNNHWVSVRHSDYEFSPLFLEDFSIVVENHRERRKADKGQFRSGGFCDLTLCCNKLHVICAVFMILEKGQAAIKKHDRDMPKRPQNTRQIDASRYRQSQLSILEIVLGSLCERLTSYMGIDTLDNIGCPQVVRLEHTLTSSPKRLLKDFRNVLNAGVGSRDPAKIRQRGGTDFAFTVWLCGLWLCKQIDGGKNREGCADAHLEPRFVSWLVFLLENYPDGTFISERRTNTDILPRGSNVRGCFDSVCYEEAEEDLSLVIPSYLEAICAAVAKHPHSLYNDPKITIHRLQWCLNVIRSEGVRFPNLQQDWQEAEDEWILFLHDKDAEREGDTLP